jgi:hypothetical protein
MTNSPPRLNRISTVVHHNNNHNNNSGLKSFLKRQTTVVPYSNNNSGLKSFLKRQNTVVPYLNNNSVLKSFLKRQNTVVPYSNKTRSKPNNNNFVAHLIAHKLKRTPTVVMEMGGERKTRRNKKVRKTRRSHKK